MPLQRFISLATGTLCLIRIASIFKISHHMNRVMSFIAASSLARHIDLKYLFMILVAINGVWSVVLGSAAAGMYSINCLTAYWLGEERFPSGLAEIVNIGIWWLLRKEFM